jgi:hypothetical protein
MRFFSKSQSICAWWGGRVCVWIFLFSSFHFHWESRWIIGAGNIQIDVPMPRALFVLPSIEMIRHPMQRVHWYAPKESRREWGCFLERQIFYWCIIKNYITSVRSRKESSKIAAQYLIFGSCSIAMLSHFARNTASGGRKAADRAKVALSRARLYSILIFWSKYQRRGEISSM